MPSPWFLPPLSPYLNSTILTTGTSARVFLGTDRPDANTVQIANVGTAEAFVAFGDVTVVALPQGGVTASGDGSTSIPAGAILAFSANLPAVSYAAAVTNTGTTTLRLTRGNGT